MSQLRLEKHMMLLNMYHVSEQCNYHSPMAKRTVGQLWDQGLCSHVVVSVNVGQRQCLTHFL